MVSNRNSSQVSPSHARTGYGWACTILSAPATMDYLTWLDYYRRPGIYQYPQWFTGDVGPFHSRLLYPWDINLVISLLLASCLLGSGTWLLYTENKRLSLRIKSRSSDGRIQVKAVEGRSVDPELPWLIMAAHGLGMNIGFYVIFLISTFRA